MSGTPTAAAITLEQSTTRRALWLPEIQDRIHAFNDEADAVRCARVCKAWKGKALDHVWFELPGLEPILRLFAPLVLNPGQTNAVNDPEPARLIGSKDWVRATPFLLRVRKLEINFAGSPFPRESLIDLLVSRPDTRILPNLTSLFLEVGTSFSQLRYMVPFIHDRLEILTISAEIGLSEPIKSDAEFFLEEVAYRATKLEQIELLIETGVAGKLDDILSRFFRSQTSLITVFMAPGSLTTPVLKSLSYLPRLKQITLDHETYTKKQVLDACRNIECEQCDGESFPSLEYLDLQTRAASVTSLISSHSNFARLLDLSIDIIFQDDAEDIRKCLEAISTTCICLKVLEFTRNADDGNRAAILNEETNPLTKDTIAPLASFRFLESFTLTHTQPLIIGDDDLVEILGRCVELTDLHINPRAIQMPSSPSALPSLEVLHRIAKCQPKLKHLSLYLTAAKGQDSDLPYNTGALLTPFEHLETLDLGKSFINNVYWAIGYLSQVLPPKCTLEYEKISNTFSDKWAKVWKRLPTFIQIFSEQRKRVSLQIGLLEEKVKSLECELSSLKETPAVDEYTVVPNMGEQEPVIH